MYCVQTPVVSAPLTPKAHFNTYIWGRKFETYNSVHYSEYFDIIFVPCKFCQFEFVETRAKLKGCVILCREIDGDRLKKRCVLNIKTCEIATSTHEIAIFSKMNVSKLQTHVFLFQHIVI